MAPLRQAGDAGDLHGLCELCEGAAFLGAEAVQGACVAALAQLVESCRTPAGVARAFGIRGGVSMDHWLRGQGSVVDGWRAVLETMRSDCLADGAATARALSLRMTFARALVPHCGEGSAAACLSQDLVEEVCLAMDSGIDHVNDEVELRAACAAGGRVVVLVLDGDIKLTEYLRPADGTALRGGTLRGQGLLVRGSTVRVEDVAILDSQEHGILVRDGGVVAVHGGLIAGSGSDGVYVSGAGSRASLTGVAVENSRTCGIWAGGGGVGSLHGGSVSGSGECGVAVGGKGSRASLTGVAVENSGSCGILAKGGGVVSLLRRPRRGRRLGNE